jgi:hypothetical protein
MTASQWLGVAALIFILGFIIFVFFTGTKIKRSHNSPDSGPSVGGDTSGGDG